MVDYIQALICNSGGLDFGVFNEFYFFKVFLSVTMVAFIQALTCNPDDIYLIYYEFFRLFRVLH